MADATRLYDTPTSPPGKKLKATASGPGAELTAKADVLGITSKDLVSLSRLEPFRSVDVMVKVSVITLPLASLETWSNVLLESRWPTTVLVAGRPPFVT